MVAGIHGEFPIWCDVSGVKLEHYYTYMIKISKVQVYCNKFTAVLLQHM
jgi:hypothetical protein